MNLYSTVRPAQWISLPLFYKGDSRSSLAEHRRPQHECSQRAGFPMHIFLPPRSAHSLFALVIHQRSPSSICDVPLTYLDTRLRNRGNMVSTLLLPETTAEVRTYQSPCDRRPALGCPRAARQCWSRQWACLRGNPQRNGGLHPLPEQEETGEKQKEKTSLSALHL